MLEINHFQTFDKISKPDDNSIDIALFKLLSILSIILQTVRVRVRVRSPAHLKMSLLCGVRLTGCSLTKCEANLISEQFWLSYFNFLLFT